MGIIIALFFHLSVEVVVQIKKLKLPALVYAWLIQSTFKQKKKQNSLFVFCLLILYFFCTAVLHCCILIIHKNVRLRIKSATIEFAWIKVCIIWKGNGETVPSTSQKRKQIRQKVERRLKGERVIRE